MVRAAGPSVVVFFLGVGQSVSGWQSPLIGAAMMAIGVVWGIYLLATHHKSLPANEGGSMADDSGRTNININTTNQSGGQNIGQVNIGAQSRSLAKADTGGLRAAAAEFAGAKVTVVAAMGDGESAAFASEIVQLLSECGWEVRGPDQAMSVGPPVEGLELRTPAQDASGDPWVVRLGNEFLAAGFECQGMLGYTHPEIRVGRAT